MKKKYLGVIIAIVSVLLLGTTAFAADEFNLATVMTSSFQTIVTDLLATIAALFPIILSLFSVTFGIGFAVKWFKKLTGKA